MTVANRVWETSATTGTGSLTLAGAVANYQTFNSGYGTDVSFSYWIDNEAGDWEAGVGHLSASTTLVRDTILDNSAGTLVALSFTGDLQVFVQRSAQYSDFYARRNSSAINFAEGWYISPHLAGDSLVDATNINANKVYLVPFWWDGGVITEMSTKFATTINSSTKFRLGVYHCEPDGDAGGLIGQTGNLTPVINTVVEGSLASPINLAAGWYFTAYLDDGGARLKGQNGTNSTSNPLGVRAFNSNFNYAADSISSGWTVMPATVVINEIQATNAIPRILVK